MTIVIAGGTGFLGRALSAALTQRGHRVVVLSRRATASPGVETLAWNPDGNVGPWASAIDGAGAVVNLAGESIAAGRWTQDRKRTILESRILPTRSLVAAIRGASRPPAVFLSASAQGYYGDHGDQIVTEDTPPGEDYLASVCVQWEEEARKAADATRLVLLRTGIVLSKTEGALPRMLLPFKLFGGGPLGSGRQFMAWIHWRDWVGMTVWAFEAAGAVGAFNLSAPSPVRNAEFSAALGRVLHRPSWLPAPAFAIRAGLGEMADALLFSSTRMIPRRALDLGYRFEFEDLEEALRDLV